MVYQAEQYVKSYYNLEFSKSNTIAEKSEIAFRTPSPWAKENLYYCDMYGTFCCDSRYYIERDSFDSYLLILTENGFGTVETALGAQLCYPGQIALIDCHQWHRYYAKESWEFYWFHFSGQNSKALVSYILENKGQVLPLIDMELALLFKQISLGYCDRSLESEFLLSGLIYQILVYLARKTPFESTSQTQEIVKEAIQYIDMYFTRDIKIEQLAKDLGISKTGFSRAFKAETGFSPYDYLLKCRFEMAKKLLCTTDLTVGEISYQIGFKSEANFIKLFRQKHEMTPMAFRKSPIANK